MEKRCTRRELFAVHGKLEHCCASVKKKMHVHMKRCRKCSAARRHPLLLHSEAAPSCRRKKVQGPFGRMPAVRPRERIEKSRQMFLHPPKVFFSKVTTQLLLRKSECCEVSFSSSTKQKLAQVDHLCKPRQNVGCGRQHPDRTRGNVKSAGDWNS